MIRIDTPIIINSNPNIGIINIDVDIDAERLMLIDRDSLIPASINDVTGGGLYKYRVPLEYATTIKLTVVIFDNDLEFNAAILDGVSAEIIKASEF